jgi:hypothetical protein
MLTLKEAASLRITSVRHRLQLLDLMGHLLFPMSMNTM